MDNAPVAPVIPSGTESMHNAAYNPLLANGGQAHNAPDSGQSPAGNSQQAREGGAPSGTTSFEALAAKKGFKSADDLASAYENLESQNKRVEMSLAELVKIRNDNETASPSNELPQEVETQEDAMKVVEKVVRKMTRPLEDKLALQELFYKNPDAQAYASDMAKVVKDNPGVSWEVAYRAAKFDALEKQSREKGRQEAYQTMEQKKAVQTEPSRPQQKAGQSLAEIINDKSIPFAEVQRIMKERFSTR